MLLLAGGLKKDKGHVYYKHDFSLGLEGDEAVTMIHL